MTNLADWAVSMLTPWSKVIVSGNRMTGLQVHKFRVMTKRLRAAWMLAESVDGVKGGKAAREDLKQLAKRFGSVRDGDVLTDLVRIFVKDRKSPVESGFVEWMEACIHEHFQVDADACLVDSWSEKALSRAIDAWMSQREHLEMRPGFMRGIGRTEEKFRRRAMKALKTDDEKDWHRCRRWAKYLYFEYLTLSEMADEELSRPNKRLRVFASELGKRNDLANLKSVIQAERKGSDFSDTLKDMKSWVAERDARFEKSTKAFVIARLKDR